MAKGTYQSQTSWLWPPESNAITVVRVEMGKPTIDFFFFLRKKLKLHHSDIYVFNIL